MKSKYMVNEGRSSVNSVRETMERDKMDHLVSLSTITRMHVKPSESGKSVIKSIEIEDQGRSLSSRGLR